MILHGLKSAWAFCRATARAIAASAGQRAMPADSHALRVASDVPMRARSEAASSRVTAALLCSVLVAVPFLVVRFPPITDLPQHVAQIRLFLAALGDPDSGYRIQWFTPYSAAYALLGAAWALCAPVDAGRVAVLVLGVLWTLAVHGLAARRRRPVASAVLASMLFFSPVLYWGFVNFAVGWPVFVAWLLLTTRAPAVRSPVRDSAEHGAVAALLYASHVLWLAAALLWLLVAAALHRAPLAQTARRLASMVPVLIAVMLWYPHLAASGFDSETVWAVLPTARLSYAWVGHAVLGGLRTPVELCYLALVGAWIGAGLWQNRASSGGGVDRDLLAAGLMLVALAVLLPDKHTNTIQLAARWMPPAAILLILAVPAPMRARRVLTPLALLAAAGFCLATSLAWQRFEREELSGLNDVLSALPANQRVIGLDLVKSSAVVEERPFLQTFAYAQVVHGGTLNFSFAEFAPSLVVFAHHRPPPWTGGLEWLAERVRASDFQHFDYAVVNATDDVHRALSTALPLAPQTSDGRWRLYRVAAPAS